MYPDVYPGSVVCEGHCRPRMSRSSIKLERARKDNVMSAADGSADLEKAASPDTAEIDSPAAESPDSVVVLVAAPNSC